MTNTNSITPCRKISGAAGGLRAAARAHVIEKILPFWMNLRDDEYGGFYGYMDQELQTDQTAVKGCILNSRILWFFSNAVLTLHDETYLPYARHAWEFLRDHCVDREFGGVFWSVAYDGSVEDGTKHVYNQAFAVYALASYYDASGDKEALTLAWELFDIIENKGCDEGGYLEAFARDFSPCSNEKLSENGVMAERTMNTLLHVFEAYTELYRVTKDERPGKRLEWMLSVFLDKVYQPERRRLEVFFDLNWNSLIDLHSYGHDIEASWLIDRGGRLLSRADFTAAKDSETDVFRRVEAMTGTLANEVYAQAYEGRSLCNEKECGRVDCRRVWWVQAEAVVGFLHAYEKAPDRGEYLQASLDIWDYIMEKMVDHREGGEWFWVLEQSGKPVPGKPVVEPWKCPYHNGRMCFEIINRLEEQ